MYARTVNDSSTSSSASASPAVDVDVNVDGYILQAPTSDRETASLLMPPEFLAKSLNAAEELIKAGKKDEVMSREYIPPIFNSPVTAYRWHSLVAKGFVRTLLSIPDPR